MTRTRLSRFFPDIRNVKNFLIPWRRGTTAPTPAVATFTHAANGRARAANRAANKRARASRKRNR